MNEVKCPYCEGQTKMMCSKKGDRYKYKLICLHCRSRTMYHRKREQAIEEWMSVKIV